MKKVLFHYYHKEALEIKQVSHKVYLVICQDGKYALKVCENTKIEWACHYIQSLHLDVFVYEPLIIIIMPHIVSVTVI